MQLPHHLRQTLEHCATGFKRAELERAANAVSDRYRRLEKADVLLGIASETEAMAYGATRLPATFASASKALEALQQGLPDFAPASVLDVGAGPATASFAALEQWPEIEALALIEQNPHLLKLGKQLLQATCSSLEPEWKQAEITGIPLNSEQYDLVLSGYVLNEIEQEKGMAALEAVVKKLWEATAGALVIIEPGTPAGYATLMRVRNWLVGAGAQIVAPCPHMKPCPLQDVPQKWCHFSVRVERSKLHKQVKPDATLPYEDEKFSYVVASRKQPVWPAYRLIGQPRGTKLIDVDVCTDAGEAKHLKAAKSHPQHKAFRRADWGDGVG